MPTLSGVTRTPVYDFSFLDGAFAKVGAVERPVNVFDIAGFPRRETVASNVLAFFLDPNERHGLATLVVDSLLVQLDGSPGFGSDGRLGDGFRAADHLGSLGWTVTTEEPTRDGKRIDVFLSNEALDVAVVIENKMDAAVYNPMASYVRHAAARRARTLAIVLSPTRRSLDEVGETHRTWVSAALTYDDIFDRLGPFIDLPPEGADLRSVDLLRQFIHNTSEKESRMDAAAESQSLEEFWGAIQGREDGFVEFFHALERVNRMLKRRAEGLRAEILSRLEPLEVIEGSFVSVGYEHKWGLYEARVAVVYIGFRLVSGPAIELVMGFVPEPRRNGLHIKAYAKSPSRLLPGYDHVPLGLDYSDPDADIAERFVQVVQDLQDGSGRRQWGSEGSRGSDQDNRDVDATVTE